MGSYVPIYAATGAVTSALWSRLEERSVEHPAYTGGARSDA